MNPSGSVLERARNDGDGALHSSSHPSDREAVLGLLNRYGYLLTAASLRPLMIHLSRLDGREVPWGTDYLIAVARGQLKASHRLLDAIDRCMRSCPAPDPNVDTDMLRPSRICACGRVFVPNVPWRTDCYQCRRPRVASSPQVEEA